MDEIFDDFEVGQTEDGPRVKRARKPYKEAVSRPSTKIEAFVDDEGLFGDIEDAIPRPDMGDLYLTMEQLHAVEATNGMTAISTFTGCGGSKTGFAWAGWKELLSVEFVKAARETLAENYPSTMIEPEDVLKIAERWVQDNGSSLRLATNSSRKVKGTPISESINWERTIQNAAEDNLPEEFTRFRHEVTKTCIEEKIIEGRMPIWGDDIRGFDPYAFMEIVGMEPGDLDCFEGSPPCKSFSTAGLRDSAWGEIMHYSDERDQRTDDLFIEYVRLLTAFKPKSFVAENVAGLTMGDVADDMMGPLMEEFALLGYTVEARLLNAKDYGVPQSRPRVIFQGIRSDLVHEGTGRPVLPTWPATYSFVYTCQDALDAAGESPEDELAAASLEGYELGKIWNVLKHGAAPENKAFQAQKAHPDLPVPTITATGAGNMAAAGAMHPHECRKFTVNEYRWLFSFPRDYVFTGTFEQQGERMGRSVPPLFMKEVAEELARNIKDAVPSS